MSIIIEDNRFSLQTKSFEYSFGVDENNVLRHFHWGKKVSSLNDFMCEKILDFNSNESYEDYIDEEFSFYGEARYKNCSLKVTFSDLNRSLKLSYVDFSLNNNCLDINLKDDYYKLRVKLTYVVFEEYDIIERTVEVINEENSPIIIESISSGEFNLPLKKAYNIHNVQGTWAGEHQPLIQKLNGGQFVFESRKGNTGHNNLPYFIAENDANLNFGETYFATLKYTGNFKVSASRTPFGKTRVTIGINDFDFGFQLKGNNHFTAPTVIFGYSNNGLNGVSNIMNKFAVEKVLPKAYANKQLPVLYNGWETVEFDVNEENQMKIVETAANLGVELFVIDDGWFGKRNNDKCGLGDWYINKEKFKNGLKPLIDKVNQNGMDFGLWFEPEMVNPDSDLYRSHPNWVYSQPNRIKRLMRNQLVLNMTMPEVQEYLFNALSNIFANNNIKYVKWDMNRSFTEAGAENLKDNQKALWYLHNEAVLNLVARLRYSFPDISFEACASGGGRVDYGALSSFDMVWPSDNTEAVDRIKIQEGYMKMYPTKCMRAWVTDIIEGSYDVPLDFRFVCAMEGALGIGGNISKWSQENLELSKQYINKYKTIRNTIQFGKRFILSSINDEEKMHAVQYTNLDKSQSVAIILVPQAEFISGKEKHICFNGLDESKKYKYELNGDKYIKSGSFLNNVGLDLTVKKAFANILIVFEEVI